MPKPLLPRLPRLLCRVALMLAAATGLGLPAGALAVPAASAAAAAWPVALEPHLEASEDAPGTLGPEQVRALPAAHWRPVGAHPAQFTLSRSAWWLRLRVHNPGAEPLRRIVELPEPLHDYLDFYAYTPDGRRVAEYHTGDRRAYATRAVNHPGFVFPFTVAAGESVDVYLRLATHDGWHASAPLRLWDAASFFNHAGQVHMGYGLYYGALLALLVYNLFLFVATRDGLFGHYALYLGAFFLWNATLRGYTYELLWPGLPWLQNQAFVALALLCATTASLFSLRLLELPRLLPRAHRLVQGLIALQLMALAVPLLGYYRLSWMIATPLCLGTAVVLAGSAAVLARRGSRAARFWLLAWSVLLLGVLLFALRALGVMPASLLTSQALQLGSALEFLLLAFALAERMNQLKADKLAAERAARETQARLTEELESQVRERTLALQAANQRLTEMSITDELTGAYNRRHFNEVIARELKRRDRRGGLALALVDVDHFKAYNDRYGHHRGDQALQALARVAQSLLRRSSDHFFRVGGEEFALVFHAEQQSQAAEFLEVLRETVERIALKHTSAPQGVLSISVGVVYVPPSHHPPEPEVVYARADALLYEAKAAGRNRVCHGACEDPPPAATPAGPEAAAPAEPEAAPHDSTGRPAAIPLLSEPAPI